MRISNLSTLAQELVFWEWLLKIVPPGRQISVRVCADISGKSKKKLVESHSVILIYVILGWKINGITSSVDSVLGLINSDPVNAHCRRKRQVFKIDISEISGHSKVGNQILVIVVSEADKPQ